MPDTKEIVVTLRIAGDNNDENKEQPKVDVGSSESSKGDSFTKSAYWVMGVQAAKIVATDIVDWSMYNWNKELTLNDDYIGQRNKQHLLQATSKILSAAGTIGSATAMGAAFGPVGAAVGAAIGTLSVISSVARENAQGQDQQNIMLRQMNAQLGYTRQRAGWSLEAASIGEDL